jgi:hypothetical protein
MDRRIAVGINIDKKGYPVFLTFRLLDLPDNQNRKKRGYRTFGADNEMEKNYIKPWNKIRIIFF